MQQAAVVLFILGQERLIQVEVVIVIEQDLEHRCPAQFLWYAAHQLADFRDGPVLLFQEFLIFPGKVSVQPVLDKHLPAAEVILLVIIKTEAVFKIPAALTGPRRKWVKAAGSRAGGIDTALVALQKNTGCFCSNRFECVNGIPFIGERCGLAVLEKHIIRTADTAMLLSKVFCHPVGVQAFHHDTALDAAAAMAALAALVCDKLLGAYGNSKGFGLFHTFLHKKGRGRQVRLPRPGPMGHYPLLF